VTCHFEIRKNRDSTKCLQFVKICLRTFSVTRTLKFVKVREYKNFTSYCTITCTALSGVVVYDAGVEQ